jgi:hypothetical protein
MCDAKMTKRPIPTVCRMNLSTGVLKALLFEEALYQSRYEKDLSRKDENGHGRLTRAGG